MADTRIKLLNVTPTTWALLKEDNRDELPLEAEHDSGWHDYDGGLLIPERTLANLSALGSPEALLYLEVTDYEGYKEVDIYQLDSRKVRSIQKFNRKVCQVLGLEVQPHRLGGPIQHCIDTKTLPSGGDGALNGKLHVSVYYDIRGGVFTYNISVWAHNSTKVRGTTLEGFSLQCTITGLRHLRWLKALLSIE